MRVRFSGIAGNRIIYDKYGQSQTEILNVRNGVFVSDGLNWRVESGSQPNVFMPTKMTIAERDAIAPQDVNKPSLAGIVIWCTDYNGPGLGCYKYLMVIVGDYYDR